MQTQWGRAFCAFVFLVWEYAMAEHLMNVRSTTPHRGERLFETQLSAKPRAITAAQMELRTQEHALNVEPQRPTYNEETRIHEALPTYGTYETFLATVFVCVIAGGPVLISQQIQAKATKTAVIQAVMTVLCLVGGIYLFMNVIFFESSHFMGQRHLTIVESVYLLAQIITTVGYGDIVPAYPRGQVVVGFFVVLSLLLIVDLVCLVSRAVILRVQSYSLALAQRTVKGSEQGAAPIAPSVLNGPSISYMPTLTAGISLLFFVIAGILFFHLYPGEEKTWFQAAYMSAITLTTVGFGAFTANTTGGQVFGAFWMLFGVAAFASFVAAFTEVCFKLKERNRHSTEFIRAEIAKLPLQGGSSKPDRLEFLCFSALHLGIASTEQLDSIKSQFMKMKPDKHGLVTLSILRHKMSVEVRKTSEESSVVFGSSESAQRRTSPKHSGSWQNLYAREEDAV